MSRRAALLAVALLAVGSAIGPTEPVGAVASPRVLVLALPTLAWEDLHAGDTPAIDSLVDESAIGGLSVRDILPITDAADGYATIGAGSRARGVASSGEVLEATEVHLGTTGAVAFERQTGTVVDDGLVAFAHHEMVEVNEALDYDAQVGLLGETLGDRGIPAAVIANADGVELVGAHELHRSAGTALMDQRGVVRSGAVSEALLRPAPDAPYGIELDPAAVRRSFDAAWTRGGVVLVEGSDLARADRAMPSVAPDRRDEVRRGALRRTDALVADLLERVDLSRDAVLLVGPYHRAGPPHLTVAALHAPGVEPGLLRSGSTRRTGLVTLVDVAPTILDLVGVPRPPEMEGRRFEAVSAGAPTGPDRAADLAELDTASRYRDRMVTPVAVAFVVLQALLWMVAAVAFRRGDRARTGVALAALVMLAYLPATYLAGLFDLHDAPPIVYWAFVLGVSVGIALLATALGRARVLDPLLLVLGLLFGLLAVDMLLGAPLQLNTVFGYSPTVGGRFAGMGNLAFGQFAGAALLLCGLLARRLSGHRRGAALAFGVLVVAVLIDGVPIWGSDVGGVLALVPAAGVTAAIMLDRRVRWKSVVVWGAVAVGIVVAFAAIDLTRPPDRRTHLGRLAESLGDQGAGALGTVVSRKLGANLDVVFSSVWMAMVPVALGFIVYLLWRAPGQVRSIRDTIRESLPGLAVVGFLGFALNDSGIAVPGVMLGVVNASLVYLTVRTLTPEALE